MKPEVQQIETQRNKLVFEKQVLSHKLASLGLSKNRRKSKSKTIQDDALEQRDLWAKRVSEIEIELFKLKSERRNALTAIAEENELLKTVLEETFGADFVKKVFIEIERRSENKPPLKVSIPTTKVKTFKNELIECYKMIMQARETINIYIRQKEPEINKADYFKQVSELNRCLPPLQNLSIEKRRLNI